MSDTMNTNVDDTSEIEDESNEVNIANVYGIDPATHSVASLVKLYESEVGTIEAHNDKFRKGLAKDEVTEEAKKFFVESDDTLVSLFSGFGEELFTYLDASNESLHVAVSQVSSLLDSVRDYMNYRLDAEVARIKRDGNIPTTENEEAQDAYANHLALLKLIQTRVEMARLFATMGQKMDPEVTAIQKVGSDGKTRLNISNKRTLDSGVQNRGRNAKSKRVNFAWAPKGSAEVVSFPLGTTLDTIAVSAISSGAYRVTRKNIEKLLKDTNQDLFKGFSLTFETGTLMGKLPE